MENEFLFEHLINNKVSSILRWVDLYRSASVVDKNGLHNAIKVSRTELCLSIALDKLRQELSGEHKKIVEKCYDQLLDSPDFGTIDKIITTLHKQNIIN